MYSGIILITIGVVFLLKNLGIIPEVGHVLWPVLIVIFGLSLIFKKRK